MKTHDLFVYGTLMFPRVVEAILGRCPEFQEATLSGYLRVRVKGQPYPVILPEAGSNVTGRVLVGLSQTEITTLDTFEGEMYCRANVEVAFANGSLRLVDVYRFASGYETEATDENWEPEAYQEKFSRCDYGELRQASQL